MSALLAFGVLTFPGLALAEVMDKETPPWEPLHLVLTAIATGACVLLAWRPRWTSTLGATVLAAAWAWLRLQDDLYDPYVGPAIRSELSATAFEAYRWLVPLQAMLPAVITVGFILARRVRLEPVAARPPS